MGMVRILNVYLGLLVQTVRLHVRETGINQGIPEAVVKGRSHRRLGDMQLYNLGKELYLCYHNI